jgi:hypothetical protein
MFKFNLTNIEWDKEVDGEIQDVDLPESMQVEAEDEDSAVDVASDITGYCILSVSVEREQQ